MTIHRNFGVFSYCVMHGAYEAHHEIDSAIRQTTIVRIRPFGAGHIGIELQCRESFRAHGQRSLAIILW